MFQPKIQLELPTHLQPFHFANPTPLSIDSSLSMTKNEDSVKIVTKLSSISSEQDGKYDKEFILNFLLIKINSWLTYDPFKSATFITCLMQYYNGMLGGTNHQFNISRNDGELMAQILLKSGAYEFVLIQDLDEVLQGSALIGSAVVQTCIIAQKILSKCYFNVVLGSVSLFGRTDPYIPIVHVEKNHWGQIEFARRINELIHLNPLKTKINVQIIQDAYSLRCSPQVHGILLQCLGHLKDSFKGLVSRPQTRYMMVDSKRMRNLALRSQSQILMLDNLIFCLNQIGHMSFLRAQRILNKHLTKNNIVNSHHYDYLMAMLKKTSYLVCYNKLLAVPSNTDTILFNNYQHDIYVNEGSAYIRFQKMVGNIKKIFKLQLMGAIDVISSLWETSSVFLNQQMQSRYEELVHLVNKDSLVYGHSIQRWLQV